ncbi:hypothetical protein V1478_007302 [Vespula squamosa]|uniref:Uncharacterized protein n=1 Tax=Vespula squamosa TaxID=30214 RepID=A0ABD2B2R3_VESSQ
MERTRSRVIPKGLHAHTNTLVHMRYLKTEQKKKSWPVVLGGDGVMKTKGKERRMSECYRQNNTGESDAVRFIGIRTSFLLQNDHAVLIPSFFMIYLALSSQIKMADLIA